MFTLFDLFELLGFVLGAIGGIAAGYSWLGWVGGILGAFAGAAVGFLCGRIPLLVSWRFARWHLARQSATQLRAALHGGNWPAYHLFLTELARRGEAIGDEAGVFVPMLADDDLVKRYHGWSVVRAFYPDLAARIPGYDPRSPAERCRLLLRKGGLG